LTAQRPRIEPHGRLVLVSTPIGNLGDLSPRAADELADADLICAEDTRRTRELLAHAGIRGKHLVSLHGHNELSRTEEVLNRVSAGERVAVVSDAGTPAISDPGARLVRAAVEAGVDVSAVPGPSAALAALVVSGLPTERFCFEGFLPRRGSLRRSRLEQLAREQRTAVVYEAPSRLGVTLRELADACGASRPVAVARELTKLHEETWRGTLGEAARVFAGSPVRGEVVIVLGGAPERPGASEEEVTAAVLRSMQEGATARDAAIAVSADLEVPRRRAYEIALSARAGDATE
jgi:16S rRNA (cytidine1402-2'-O)-methyltransferase